MIVESSTRISIMTRLKISDHAENGGFAFLSNWLFHIKYPEYHNFASIGGAYANDSFISNEAVTITSAQHGCGM